jgi:hypothetical protein
MQGGTSPAAFHGLPSLSKADASHWLKLAETAIELPVVPSVHVAVSGEVEIPEGVCTLPTLLKPAKMTWPRAALALPFSTRRRSHGPHPMWMRTNFDRADDLIRGDVDHGDVIPEGVRDIELFPSLRRGTVSADWRDYNCCPWTFPKMGSPNPPTSP